MTITSLSLSLLSLSQLHCSTIVHKLHTTYKHMQLGHSLDLSNYCPLPAAYIFITFWVFFLMHTTKVTSLQHVYHTHQNKLLIDHQLCVILTHQLCVILTHQLCVILTHQLCVILTHQLCVILTQSSSHTVSHTAAIR